MHGPIVTALLGIPPSTPRRGNYRYTHTYNQFERECACVDSHQPWRYYHRHVNHFTLQSLGEFGVRTVQQSASRQCRLPRAFLPYPLGTFHVSCMVPHAQQRQVTKCLAFTWGDSNNMTLLDASLGLLPTTSASMYHRVWPQLTVAV
jgi:hypothetical protein